MMYNYLIIILLLIILIQVIISATIGVKLITKNEFKKQIFLTYKDKNAVPQKVWDNLKKYAPGYKIRFFNDADCINYLKKYYPPRYLDKYNKISAGAHKADIWRYCVLYREGGIYLDIKTDIIKNLDDVFKDRRRSYTVLGMFDKKIHQGIIAVPPKNPIIHQILIKAINTDITELNKNYFAYTGQFYNILLQNNISMQPGNSKDWTLFIEKNKYMPGDKPDQYNKYCKIFNKKGEMIFKTRFSDYPF